MATIVLSELAPSEAKHFSLANYEIDVPVDTEDPRLIAEARVHPWLSVELPEAEAVHVDSSPTHVAPQDDPFSADFQGTRDADDETVVEPVNPTAIDAGLDQNEAADVGPTAVTLAAADASHEEVVAEDEPADRPVEGDKGE